MNNVNNSLPTLTGYKAFNHDLTCRDFQYKIGETYKIEDDIKLCERGFHFCPKAPFDVFSFYPVIDEDGEMSRFARVSCPASKAINNDDEKIVTAEITIEEELSLSKLVEEQIQETFTHTNDSTQSASNIDYLRLLLNDYGSYLATTGRRSYLVTTGANSQIATTGMGSRLVASGNDSHLAATGAYSQLIASGGDSYLAATGAYSQLTTSGITSQLITTGYGSRLTATGNEARLVATGANSQVSASGHKSQCIVTGQNGVISISGKGGMFKGKNGTHVAIADFDEKDTCTGFVTGCIGEAGLKKNVWYAVKNGKFIECGNLRIF